MDLTSLPSALGSTFVVAPGETCYTNFVGAAKATDGDAGSFIYLYSPTILPTNTSTLHPATQLNQYILFDRDARKPIDANFSDDALYPYSEHVEIWVSGSYNTAT